MKVKHAIVIAGKNYGFVTFASPASVEQLLEMREPLEVAGSKVILRQVITFSNLVISHLYLALVFVSSFKATLRCPTVNYPEFSYLCTFTASFHYLCRFVLHAQLYFFDNAVSGETAIMERGRLEQCRRNIKEEVFGLQVERAGMVGGRV